MIYSFLSDEAFAVTKALSSVMSVSDIQTYGLGVVDDNLLNYFDKHSVVTDPVGSTRVSSVRPTRLLVDSHTGKATATTTEFVARAVGRMLLNFDDAKLGDATTHEARAISALTVSVDSDTNEVINDKVSKRAALFNILETIFFARASNGSVKSQDTINTLLKNATGSTYSGYVADSLTTSPTVTSEAAYRFNNIADTSTVLSSEYLDFYDWCTFKFKYGSEAADVVEFKVWLSVPQFKANYPYSTITDVIYPCKPEWILDPQNYGSEVKAVLQSTNYKDTLLDDAIASKDHSGIASYKTKYVHESVRFDAQMSFVVMYKGAIPSAASMNLAIRNKLLSERNKTTGSVLATEQEWRQVLPDLFIDNGFYVFPCYYQRAAFGNNVIEQNISSFRTMFDRIKRIFVANEFTDQQLFDHMEIIQAPGHGMYMVTMPIDLTTNKSVSILEIHPTYQPLDSVGSVVEFVKTEDTKYLEMKNYYVQNVNASHEFIQLIAGPSADYQVNDPIPSDMDVYERRYVLNRDDWNTMTSATKAFAWSLAKCIAACIDKNISLENTEFTAELLGSGDKRQYYSFVSNSTEYHVLTLEGAKDVFDGNTIIDEGEEHVPGYIH